MSYRVVLLGLGLVISAATAFADDTLYRYEGDVLPYDPTAGWEVFNPCEPPCSESVEDGHFVLQFTGGGDLCNFNHGIVSPPPHTLWVEWRFRSDQLFGPYCYSCDARVSTRYEAALEAVNLYGDAAISQSGDDVVVGLDPAEFHTYRFESLDGRGFQISVDGLSFVFDPNDGDPVGLNHLQFSGRGGGPGTNVTNEWDFIRYGTISFGELIIAADPPAGDLAYAQYAGLDRFVVTFDSANYVYIDDITVETSGGSAPNVLQTRRRENDEPDTVEIVLDGQIPIGETITFTFNDPTVTNVVEYTLLPPVDSDGDGLFDHEDNCPNHVNANQADCDDDGVGDVCTLADCSGDPGCGDCDGNSIPDNCQPDGDTDGLIDLCDPCPSDPANDQDGDGVCAPEDQCPMDGNKSEPGDCGCGVSDVDDDADTVPDCNDECPGEDDLLDDDGDGTPNCQDHGPVPALSSWGLALLAAALLIAARIAFGGRQDISCPK